jgi:pimeloyl-ACP methyl ester carboxylesterase
VGAAALAPAANLPGLVENLPNVSGGSIFASYVMAAYAALYDDVTYREYIRPGAEVTARQMAERCLSGPDAYVSLLAALGLRNDPDIISKTPTEGPFGARLQANVPPATVTVPLLLAQGKDDVLVIPGSQDAFVADACAAGEVVDYRLYAGLGHVDLVGAVSPLVPQLMEWTKARF